MPDLNLTEASATVFVAGNGQKYGIISLPGSKETTIFQDRDGKWYGHVTFNPTESSGLPPSEALPEVAALFAAKEKENHEYH